MSQDVLSPLIMQAALDSVKVPYDPRPIIEKLKACVPSLIIRAYLFAPGQGRLIEIDPIPSQPPSEPKVKQYRSAWENNRLSIHIYHRASLSGWKNYPLSPEDRRTDTAYISETEIAASAWEYLVSKEAAPLKEKEDLRRMAMALCSAWDTSMKWTDVLRCVTTWWRCILEAIEFSDWQQIYSTEGSWYSRLSLAQIKHLTTMLRSTHAVDRYQALMEISNIVRVCPSNITRTNPIVSLDIASRELLIVPLQSIPLPNQTNEGLAKTYAVLSGDSLKRLSNTREHLKTLLHILLSPYFFHAVFEDAFKKQTVELWAASARQVSGAVGHEVSNGTHNAIQDILTARRYPELSDDMLHRAAETLEAMDVTARYMVKLMTEDISISVYPIDFIIKSALNITRLHCELHRAQIVTGFPSEIPCVRIEKSQLILVFVSLIRNALDSMRQLSAKELKEISISIATRVTQGKEEVVVEVSDSGPGFSEAALTECFTYGFSTKNRKGGGIGLTLALRAVEMHSGSISVSNKNQGHGAVVRVHLPRV